MQKFLGKGISCEVAAINLTSLDTYTYPPEVTYELVQNNKNHYINLAKTTNTSSLITGVIIQHEYGIFGGIDGEMLLSFMENCHKPILVTFHTVLPEPSEHMKAVTAQIVKYARTIVVLTQSSKEIVERLYPESVGKTHVIPHGIHPVSLSHSSLFKKKLELKNKMVLTTFGLLSRGKGIEYVLQALPEVIKQYPSILYLILGETHPVIRRTEGEAYRNELAQLVIELGLEDHVKFYDQYFNLSDLFTFLKATDIYISSSTNPNQAVSGTLSYALGAGRTVVSTQFAQAKELVTGDLGRLVPIKDSKALAIALLDLLSDPVRLKKMHANAHKKTRSMLWSTVAEKYMTLLSQTIIPPVNLDHLHAMTDDFGLFQFAKLSLPDTGYGYTLDDNARALIVCSWLLKKSYSKELESFIAIYLAFIKKCQLPDGTFVNYLNFPRKIATNQNISEDVQEAQTRALWALGECMSNELIHQSLRDTAKELFLKSWKRNREYTHLRARAYAIKAFSFAQKVLPQERNKLLAHITTHSNALLASLQANSFKTWHWFEHSLNYNNGLLPESLFIAGEVTGNEIYTKKGIYTLAFLISKTFSSQKYLPVGHSHWYANNKKRSEFDQQPEDPNSMMLALVSAYKYTHDETYKALARKCFSWFLGNNSLNKPLYDVKTGGCYDGLHPKRVNLNQGAESLISYLMSSYSMTELN